MVTVPAKTTGAPAFEPATTAGEVASKSAQVREGVQTSQTSGQEADPPTSALDLAPELVGTFEGPEDLSTNPKYMEAFGE